MQRMIVEFAQEDGQEVQSIFLEELLEGIWVGMPDEVDDGTSFYLRNCENIQITGGNHE